jgi:mRNA interferase RelE/StbE
LHEVIFTRRARKSMSRFPRREYERVLRAIEGLAEDPNPTGARKMRGTGNLGDWRIRVGRDYRVIYRLAVCLPMFEIPNKPHAPAF